MALLRPEPMPAATPGYLSATLYGTALVVAAIAGVYAVAPVYEVFMNTAMKALVMNSAAVAWICAGISLLIAMWPDAAEAATPNGGTYL
jgi:hypothetical protein